MSRHVSFLIMVFVIVLAGCMQTGPDYADGQSSSEYSIQPNSMPILTYTIIFSSVKADSVSLNWELSGKTHRVDRKITDIKNDAVFVIEPDSTGEIIVEYKCFSNGIYSGANKNIIRLNRNKTLNSTPDRPLTGLNVVYNNQIEVGKEFSLSLTTENEDSEKVSYYFDYNHSGVYSQRSSFVYSVAGTYFVKIKAMDSFSTYIDSVQLLVTNPEGDNGELTGEVSSSSQAIDTNLVSDVIFSSEHESSSEIIVSSSSLYESSSDMVVNFSSIHESSVTVVESSSSIHESSLTILESSSLIHESSVTTLSSSSSMEESSAIVLESSSSIHESSSSSSLQSVTVSFELTSTTQLKSVLVQVGEKVTKPAFDSVRLGYQFAGWYTDETYNVEWDFNSPVIKDTKLFAKWNMKTVSISFNSAGGTSVDPAVIQEGKPIIKPLTVPKRTGYRFIAWTYSGQIWDFSTSVYYDMELVASWNPVYYDVEFNSNGGSSSFEKQTILEGEVAVNPGAVKKYGYKFDGWYRNNIAWNFNTPITENVTLEARWSIQNYTVSLDAGVSGAVYGDITVQEGQAIGSGVVAPPTRFGYSFDGWFHGTTRWDVTTDAVVSDMTLVAKWIQVFHNVYFDLDVGGGSVDPQVIAEGAKITEPNAPKSNNYRFEGWQVDGKFWDFNTGIVTKELTLVAVWKKYIIVSVNADSQYEPIRTVAVVEGEPVPNQGTPYRGTDVFLGWYNGDVKWDFNNPAFDRLVLKAKWRVQ